MFGKSKNQPGVTLIAQGAGFDGNLQFSGELFVYGRVRGNITGLGDDAKMTLWHSGVIEGDICVPRVVIDGRIKGDVYASGKVELAEKAIVEGNVHYELIEMQLGARIDGQLVHAGGDHGSGSNVLPLPERKFVHG
ncbi:MAG: polymer-forming cytoskeletal protein [Gammaproteobacteria bacterium]|nr:polymer-forming cytoskeletal protein [Gammaproteobacteria bacterium]